MREVGAGEDAVADQNHESGERAGPLLREAGRYGLHDLVCAFRVEDSLQSWKCTEVGKMCHLNSLLSYRARYRDPMPRSTFRAASRGTREPWGRGQLPPRPRGKTDATPR